MAVFPVQSAAAYVVGDAALDKLEVKAKSLKLVPGEELQLEVLATYGDGSSEEVTDAAGIQFESSVPEQVEVDETGRIRVLADASGGTRATITIQYEGKTVKVYVFVRNVETSQ